MALTKEKMDNLPPEEISHDSRAVANRILEKSRVKNQGIDSLSIMKLLKLVYFAHGWSLVFSDVPLVQQSPQAWKYGPVYEDIYDSLSNWGKNTIKTLIIDEKTKLPYSEMFTASQDRVIDFVLEKYSNFSAFALSDKTHQLGTPWDISFKGDGVYSEISNNLMQKHYRKQAKQEGIYKI